MIHTIVYTYATAQAPTHSPYSSTARNPKVPATIDVWAEVKKVLENTHDTFIWVVTTEQLDPFMKKVRHYGVEKYLKVRMDKADQGTTNRNYPDRPKRLKVFVMKGAK